MSVMQVNWNPTARELRVFAVLQLVFFGIICWLFHRQGAGRPLLAGILAASSVVLICGFVWQPLVRAIYIVWMAAVFPIGWVVSHTVLAGVYYLVLTPIGWLLWICGRRPLPRQPDSTAKTYWTRREADHTAQRYFRQY